ncbi:MAG: Ig-like domain-containing protein, partial [Nitrospirae bacterium]|nr:Ig-like domain-containing protein [Nitrospirota bacterium]
KAAGLALALFGLGGLLALGSAGEAQAQAATAAIIDGVIDRVTLDSPGDHWSGGTIEVGGQKVIIPRNLLMDLPANRLTLQEFMAQAPGLCPALGQSGLGRGDSPFCNTSGQPGYALIHTNRTSNGNTIAGDVFIQKGIDAVSGTVTYINYSNGYFRMNGIMGDPTTGVMVRINDPDSRHTVQSGPGCVAGQSNCSPDPRFTLDGDNYTNTFTTGFPMCIPSAVSRSFTDVLDLNTNGNVIETLVTAASPADGTGDLLCPTTNRTVSNGNPVDDSRRFAPIMLGDSMTVEGNFERINGVRFLSAHSSTVRKALTTKNLPDQPDYLFLAEVEVDAAGFQNQRVRTLIIGFATKSPEDVLIWSLHYDPTTNSAHELPLATVLGCDIAGGPGTCRAQGITGIPQIFKIRHDVDFLVGADPRMNPCAHLIADPRMHTNGVPCNNNPADTNTRDMFGILAPIPHEIQARTGHELANAATLRTIDINGNEATHGQYLFPFGVGLGGVSFPEFDEIDLDATATPHAFSALPWNLDRRLSPGGCFPEGVCEGTPQPLTPFPFELLDPRLQASLPLGAYTDLAFTQAPLTDVRNRILSYVDATGRANGNTTVLAWPPANPGPIPITPVAEIPASNLPPLITSTPNLVARAAPLPNLYQYQVVATDDGGPANLTYTLGGSPPAGMSIVASGPGAGLISWVPTQAQAPAQGLTVTVTDSGGLYDKQAFVIAVNGAPSFATVTQATTARVGQQYVYQPFANDPNTGQPLTFAISIQPNGTAPLGPTAINPSTGRFTWTPSAGQVGPRAFQLRVTDAAGATSTRTFNVNVTP